MTYSVFTVSDMLSNAVQCAKCDPWGEIYEENVYIRCNKTLKPC